jgi:ABC-2 type transport system ATP-binding protein
VIQVTELRKQFGTLKAVDGVSFQIARGEVYGLLGPNGAGKTTCLGMLVGAVTADSGDVTLGNGGHPSQASVRRQIGYTPQALAIYDELSGEENVQFFGRLYGLSGAMLRAQTRSVLDLVGLLDRRDDRVRTYSGGMKRRLNLACALVHDPPILFLDEPTVGVDPQSRNLIFEKIEQLKNEGRTVIYTTHYMEEAQRLCDRIAILDNGKILAEGDLDSLLHAHGGQSVVRAIYETAPPEGAHLPGPVKDGELLFDSDRPLVDVARLVDSGHRFRSLHIDRPDLETVFLNLTGRSLRD